MIEKNYNRQGLAVAHIAISLAAFSDGAVQAAIELPAGAVVVGGSALVTTAFNATTTATLKVGDADDDDRYSGTPLNVATLGSKALAPTGYVMPVKGDLTVTYASTGTDATEGELLLVVEYIEANKSEWTQG